LYQFFRKAGKLVLNNNYTRPLIALLWVNFTNPFLKKKALVKNKKKVLYVDSFSTVETLSNVHGIQKAYAKVGVVESFDYRKLARTLGPWLMNEVLCQTAIVFLPDMVHLGKCEWVSGVAVRKIKEKTSAIVIHYYSDYRPEPQKWVVDIGREADLTLLYHKDSDLIQKHLDEKVNKVDYWWHGTCPEVFYPHFRPKLYDVVFMANNSSIAADGDDSTGRQPDERRKLITAIADRGIDIHLFGNGWECFETNKHIHLHNFVNDDEFAKACSLAKITLGYNTNKVYMYTSWRRPLNSMASGAFHLTRYFPGLESVFENRKHLVWFNSIPGAIELICYYLDHEEERNRIAEVGRKEVLTRHTWNQRIAVMFEYYNQIKFRNAV